MTAGRIHYEIRAAREAYPHPSAPTNAAGLVYAHSSPIYVGYAKTELNPGYFLPFGPHAYA